MVDCKIADAGQFAIGIGYQCSMAITAQILCSLNQMFITVVLLVAGSAAGFLQFRQVEQIGVGMHGDFQVTIDTGRVSHLDKR